MPMTVNVEAAVSMNSTVFAVSSAADFSPRFEGYAYNLTSGAPSQYDQFRFNSFAKVGNRYMATREDGLYELAGGTDAGAEIAATIQLPILPLDNGDGSGRDAQMKSIDAVYVGGTSADNMTLSVTTEDGSYDYTFENSGNVMTNTRVKVGKALRSKYWQFSVSNVGGADFEIDNLDIVVTPLTRKVY